MVFGALIEYACVGYTAKRIQLRKNRSVGIIGLLVLQMVLALGFTQVRQIFKLHSVSDFSPCRNSPKRRRQRL